MKGINLKKIKNRMITSNRIISVVFHLHYLRNKDHFALQKKRKYHSVWLWAMRNTRKSILRNTCAWEQQELNKTRGTGEEGKRRHKIEGVVQRTGKKKVPMAKL